MRVSAALMVRNEQATIAGALHNLRGRGLHEVVVLDTGSTDRTVKLATRPGVRVVEEPWRTETLGKVTTLADFAAGRNRSIELCEGADYVLLTDADYRWPKGSIERMLARLREGPEISFGYVRLHNAGSLRDDPEDVVEGRNRLGNSFPVLQLIRPVRGPWYENPIHELADAWCQREIEAGGKFGIVGDVVHYGHTPSQCDVKRKTERNMALLLRWAERDDHPQAWIYIGMMCLGDDINDLTRAEWALGRAWEQRKDPRALAHLVRLAHGLVKVLVGKADPTKAYKAVDELEAIHKTRAAEPNPDFDVLRGKILLACHEWKPAAFFLQRSLEPERRQNAVTFVAERVVRDDLAMALRGMQGAA